MKLRYKETIGEHEVVRFVADAPVDPEQTKRKVRTMVPPEITDAEFDRLIQVGDPEIKRLFNENPVYANTGEEADLISDEEGDQVKEKLAAMGEHKRLLTDGEFIVDYRGTEYWRKENDAWLKEKVENIGDALPSGAVTQEELTPEQQTEIREQEEEERIAAMDPEQRAEYEKRKIEMQLSALDREFLTPRILAGIALGDEHAIGKAQEHEQLANPLRIEWDVQDKKIAAIRKGQTAVVEEGV